MFLLPVSLLFSFDLDQRPADDEEQRYARAHTAKSNSAMLHRAVCIHYPLVGTRMYVMADVRQLSLILFHWYRYGLDLP